MSQLPHANLITGGTRNLRYKRAFNLAQDILKENPINHPDFAELKSDTQTGKIGIDLIRGLKKTAQLKPFRSKNKIILIENADNLTHEAQNAFLKLLEDPPAHTFFILSARHAKLLLPTIVSRCRQIKLKEEIDIEFDSEDYHKTAPVFIKLLESDMGKRFDWVERNLSTINSQLSTIYTLDVWSTILRDLLLLKYSLADRVLNKKFTTQLKEIEYFSTKELIRIIKRVEEGIKLLRTTNVDKRLLVEVILLELPHSTTQSSKTENGGLKTDIR